MNQRKAIPVKGTRLRARKAMRRCPGLASQKPGSDEWAAGARRSRTSVVVSSRVKTMPATAAARGVRSGSRTSGSQREIQVATRHFIFCLGENSRRREEHRCRPRAREARAAPSTARGHAACRARTIAIASSPVSTHWDRHVDGARQLEPRPQHDVRRPLDELAPIRPTKMSGPDHRSASLTVRATVRLRGVGHRELRRSCPAVEARPLTNCDRKGRRWASSCGGSPGPHRRSPDARHHAPPLAHPPGGGPLAMATSAGAETAPVG